MREARPLPELATTAQTLLKLNAQRFHCSAAPRCSPPFHALIMEVVTMGLQVTSRANRNFMDARGFSSFCGSGMT